MLQQRRDHSRHLPMHAGELRCDRCNRFRGWASKALIDFIETTQRRFGAPAEPIIWRQQQQETNMVKQYDNAVDDLTMHNCEQLAEGYPRTFRGEKHMSSNCRFALDEKRYVIDAVNVVNSGKGYCHEGAPEDDKYLRERVLMVRLGKMLEKLIINLRPMQKLPSGEEYKPRNEESFPIWLAMLDTIRASQLNTFDPALSIQHKFDGKLRRQREHTQDFTSLALFRDDVECLLRDLYGDVESEALDSILRAVFRIVEQFAKFVRPDLWKEHSEAESLDYMLGIGVPEGYGINGSDWRRGMAAKFSLIHRVREVNAKLSTFSEYTVEFANLFAQQWDCSKWPDEELFAQQWDAVARKWDAVAPMAATHEGDLPQA